MFIVPIFSLGAFLSHVAAIGNNIQDQLKIECILKDAAEFGQFVQFIEHLKADLWEESPPAFPARVSVRVEREQRRSFMSRFNCPLVSPLPVPGNPLIQKESLIKEGDLQKNFFDDYRSFGEQEAFLKHLVDTSQNIARQGVMGKSLEGRQLAVVELSSDFGNKTRKSVWVNGGQHAREWLSPAACLYLIQHAINNPQSILSKFNLIVAFNLNPDGYEQSRLVNRYWRKNKRRNRDGTIGVDLNRNWDFKWNQINGNGATSSEVYQGAGPASEPEVKATADYILANRARIAAGIDVHTFGEVVLRNYGWTLKPCKDEEKFKRFGDAMAAASGKVSNEPYRSDRSAGLYPTSGSLDDWFYEKAGFPGFTFEMRDGGLYGFVTPASFIIPNGKELVQAIIALIKEL